ncbi:phosphate transporter [Anaeromyxobacter dehalogenans 2CP-1]|uniref:Phosphate transporter n=1 Tax=Anaeromyxobacter dehalogenans (strain ATCC BAA-258 / DSM 21875 / 2CP-1) TaxID=455488 RepID=B8JBU3_ANAD2|nr:inorganic phosphate transporter [Anaeromyxobacter dehalogenans]ACL67701.1 phosphate transporter [Anaeromyxobacter dehalogenans 2CP-1]
MLILVILLVLVALAFDFINGFHDAANSIATVVSTRVLSPLVAVAWAAFFNFISAMPVLWGAELKVAATMGKGIVHFEQLKAGGISLVLMVVFAALMGAIVWNLLTWWWGLPSSSSHALAGGMIGASLPPLGFAGLIPSGILKIVAFIVLSPLIGMVLGSLMMVATAWIVRKNTPARVDRWFRRLQLVSAAIFSYSHGTNDAQKVMGIISVILYGTIWADRAAMTPGHFPVPFWVVLSCHAAIGLGTMFGGWRIVRTMGHNLTKLQPIGGFCAETGGGVTILALAHFGIPVSTTHTITGAIVGVGSTKGTRAVRWGVAGRIIWAWVFTIPAAAIVAGVIFLVTRAIVGVVGVG